MNYNKLNFRKNNKGITLLALIITIIVLLILAGISVSILISESGIVNNAIKAKRETDSSTTYEKIVLAVMASRIESRNKSVSLVNLLSELEKNGVTVVGDGNSFPLSVTDGVNKYKISEEGEVKKIISLTAGQIAADKEKYYGQKVSNYTAGGRTYRIFYVDEAGDFGEPNTIYLKADPNEDYVVLNDYSSYESKTNVILEKMNKLWAEDRLNVQESWNSNEFCASYLCDPTTNEASSNQAWVEYFDSSMADYVIGGSGVEMYVKSYEQVSHSGYELTFNPVIKQRYGSYGYAFFEPRSSGQIVDEETGAINFIMYPDTDGYEISNEFVDFEGYNGMYGISGVSGVNFCTLASPSGYLKSFMCAINGNGLRTVPLIPTVNAYTRFNIAPVVSLKLSSIIEIEE